MHLLWRPNAPERYNCSHFCNLDNFQNEKGKFKRFELAIYFFSVFPTKHIWLQIDGPSDVARTHTQKIVHIQKQVRLKQKRTAKLK